jgi:beta-N-acetylhexosaminidase
MRPRSPGAPRQMNRLRGRWLQRLSGLRLIVRPRTIRPRIIPPRTMRPGAMWRRTGLPRTVRPRTVRPRAGRSRTAPWLATGQRCGALAGLLVLTVAACGVGSSARNGAAPARGHANVPGSLARGTGGYAAAVAARTVLRTQATAITDAMSLPQKVGQLLVATVPGTSAASGGAALVSAYHLGGVIYFEPNIHTAAQVAAMSNGLQGAALKQTPSVPLLIGTDQEGGIVARLTGLATQFPDQMAAGATRDPALIYEEEQATGAEMRALGINLDYAPVADVNANPANPVIGIRSFGSNPALVSAMTEAAVAGFHAGGVAATAKHFPGHGDTSSDSHITLPVVHRTLGQWWRIDARPFKAAIRADVDEIMIGHIAVPALDPSGGPASLSHRIVTGYLRGKLGYRGVITTDSLVMAGALRHHTTAQVAVDAIRAGCDQLLMPASVRTAYQAVLTAVRRGRISMARLDASVRRVITLKLSRGLVSHAMVRVSSAGQHQNTPQARGVAMRIADRSVTMVRNRSLTGSGRTLPVRGRPVYLTGPTARALAPALRAALGRTGGHLVSSADAAGVIVVATWQADADPAQRALVAQLVATGRPVVVVATGVPYDLGLFPGAAAELATYSGAGVSLTAAAAILTGARNPTGHLPVAIPGAGGDAAYGYGTGMGY